MKTFEFQIPTLQFLNENAEIVAPLPTFANNLEYLRTLYSAMVTLRVFDTKAIALQRTGKMGTYASTLGQEAATVAIGNAMKKEDVLCPFYRDYGAQLARGVKMSEILLYWGGNERGSAYQNCPADFPMSVPIGTQTLHAVGVATAFQIRQQPRVAVTTFGDGATSEGDFYEAVNLAGTWKSPVVFVAVNNQWAISVPRSQQTGAETLAQKAIAGGIHGIQVDGNDIVAMLVAMEQALDQARRGEGATLIEALTYRLSDHTTADDAKRYRSQEEVESAWKEDPIARLKKYLIDQKTWSEEDEIKLHAQAAKEVEQAVEEYLHFPAPTVEEMFDCQYAQLPHYLKEQREIAKKYYRPAEH